MPESPHLLEVKNLTAGYGAVTVVRDVSLTVGPGQVVAILGANGAGKTSLLKAIANQIRRGAGEVMYDGRAIGRTPTARLARDGLVLVPQGRGLIPFMSIEENLELGLDTGRAVDRNELLNQVLELFPILGERSRQRASDLSGGEQQMLAIARALLMQPRCLMLDEPSEGLAPKIVAMIFDLVNEIRVRFECAIVVVEQNVRKALAVAERAYVMERGRIVLSGLARDLEQTPEISEAYLGGSVRSEALI